MSGKKRSRRHKRDAAFQLLAVRGLVAGMAPEDQAAVTAAADSVRAAVAAAGRAGLVALVWVGCEAAAGRIGDGI